jgi:predicted Na+-dependent transporter
MTELARIVAKVALLAFLLSSMLAVGLSLTPRAILAPLSNARLVLTALALNFLLAPAFALALTKVIPLERPHAIGLLLLSGAAGAPFLPKLVQDAHCDLGVAVALMTLLTVVTTLFMPFPSQIISLKRPCPRYFAGAGHACPIDRPIAIPPACAGVACSCGRRHHGFVVGRT